MGILLTKLWNRLLGDQEVKIVIVGLDNAGKTTTLYKLYVCDFVNIDFFRHLGDVVVTQPTIGSNGKNFNSSILTSVQ
jgi:GTPase SAR1 family protein